MDPDVFAQVLDLLRQRTAYLLPSDSIEAARVLLAAHELGIASEVLQPFAALPSLSLNAEASYVSPHKRSWSNRMETQKSLLVGSYPDEPIVLVEDVSSGTFAGQPISFVATRPFVLHNEMYVAGGVDGARSIENCTFILWRGRDSNAEGTISTVSSAIDRGVQASLTLEEPLFVDKGDELSFSLVCKSVVPYGESEATLVGLGLWATAQPLVHDGLAVLFREV